MHKAVYVIHVIHGAIQAQAISNWVGVCGGRGLIGSLALCKANPFPQQSRISHNGNAVEDYEYSVSN